MVLIDLSHLLTHGQTSLSGDPTLSVSAHSTTQTAARCNISLLEMGSHQGTHLDAMFHFLDHGKTLDQMPLEWFYGPGAVPPQAGRGRDHRGGFFAL